MPGMQNSRTAHRFAEILLGTVWYIACGTSGAVLFGRMAERHPGVVFALLPLFIAAWVVVLLVGRWVLSVVGVSVLLGGRWVLSAIDVAVLLGGRWVLSAIGAAVLLRWRRLLPNALLIAAAVFEREFPRLLKERPNEWVVYHKDRCLGVFATWDEAEQEAIDRDIPEEETYLRLIEEEPPLSFGCSSLGWS